MSVDYLLHESSLGYAVGSLHQYLIGARTDSSQVFKVVMQPDTIGNRLMEVQQSVLDLAKFGNKSRLPGRMRTI